MVEWERDPTDCDFGCLFHEGASPLHFHTIHLRSLELKVESINKEHAHTNNQTGLMTWEGGHLLGELVMQCPQLFKDKVLVELGAGSVPLPSIAAWHCGVRELLVSDGNQECVELARINMLRNIQTETKIPQFVQVVWGADADSSKVSKLVPNVDWILAADVTYSEQGTQEFFATVARIAAHNPSMKLLLAFLVRGVSESKIMKIALEAEISEIPLPEELKEIAKKLSSTSPIIFKVCTGKHS